MTSFITRVELHKEQPSDYDTLHASMIKMGFSRLIISNDNISYRLPTAEYNISGNFTRGEVLDKAKEAVKDTGKNAYILVTESAGRTWSGLEQIS
jgi:hypothetical protein